MVSYNLNPSSSFQRELPPEPRLVVPGDFAERRRKFDPVVVSLNSIEAAKSFVRNEGIEPDQVLVAVRISENIDRIPSIREIEWESLSAVTVLGYSLKAHASAFGASEEIIGALINPLQASPADPMKELSKLGISPEQFRDIAKAAFGSLNFHHGMPADHSDWYSLIATAIHQRGKDYAAQRLFEGVVKAAGEANRGRVATIFRKKFESVEFQGGDDSSIDSTHLSEEQKIATSILIVHQALNAPQSPLDVTHCPGGSVAEAAAVLSTLDFKSRIVPTNDVHGKAVELQFHPIGQRAKRIEQNLISEVVNASLRALEGGSSDITIPIGKVSEEIISGAERVLETAHDLEVQVSQMTSFSSGNLWRLQWEEKGARLENTIVRQTEELFAKLLVESGKKSPDDIPSTLYHAEALSRATSRMEQEFGLRCTPEKYGTFNRGERIRFHFAEVGERLDQSVRRQAEEIVQKVTAADSGKHFGVGLTTLDYYPEAMVLALRTLNAGSAKYNSRISGSQTIVEQESRVSEITDSERAPSSSPSPSSFLGVSKIERDVHSLSLDTLRAFSRNWLRNDEIVSEVVQALQQGNEQGVIQFLDGLAKTLAHLAGEEELEVRYVRQLSKNVSNLRSGDHLSDQLYAGLPER